MDRLVGTSRQRGKDEIADDGLEEGRAVVFGIESGRWFKESLGASTRFRGVRVGVRYAELLWPSYGSTDATEPWRRGGKPLEEVPVLPASI